MEYIRRNGQSLCEYIVSRFHYDEATETEERSRNMFLSLLNPVESYVISIQSILIWERPYVTTLVVVVMTCLFWLIAYFFKKAYSFLAVATLIVFLYRVWVKNIWPQIRVPPPEGEEEDTEGWTPVHPQVLSAPELSRYLDDGWNSIKDGITWFWDLRRRNPGVFCFILSSGFSLLTILGHFVPGIVIVYTILLCIMIGPGIILYVIPGSWYDQLRDTLFPAFKRELHQENDSDVEEFVPDVDSSVLSHLSFQHEDSPSREAHDNAFTFEQAVARELGIQDFTKEDEDISLYQGLENFPNVEDEEESGDEVELPQPENNEDNNGIKIIPTYYKIESSDSENELFSAGLTFTDVENTDSNSHDGQKNNDRETMADVSAADNLQQSLSSDIDIDEYEIVSKSDLAS